MPKFDSWSGELFEGNAYYFTTDNGTEVVSRVTFFKVLGFDDPMGIVPPNSSQAAQETTEDDTDPTAAS